MDLKLIWKKYKTVIEKIGNFQATVIFSVLYFIIFTPVGLLVNIIKDCQNLKQKPTFHKYETNEKYIKQLREQS